MWADVYSIFMLKGMEYIRDPENRSEILRVGFMVFLRILSMVRGKKKVDENVHIECNCKSCKVWKMKIDEMEKKSSTATSSSSTHKRPILSKISSIFSFAKGMMDAREHLV